jgi:hypothetical protein
VRRRDRLAPVARVADHLDPVGLLQQAGDAATHDGVVVDEQDADRVHCHV